MILQENISPYINKTLHILFSSLFLGSNYLNNVLWSSEKYRRKDIPFFRVDIVFLFVYSDNKGIFCPSYIWFQIWWNFIDWLKYQVKYKHFQ